MTATPLSDRARMPHGTPEQRQKVATKLDQIPDGQLACRAGRHPWGMDELEFGKPLPKSLRAEPLDQRKGIYQLVDTCPRCGKRRIITTLPKNVYDTGADYDYRDPADWVKLADELNVTKRELRAENIRRNADRLFR